MRRVVDSYEDDVSTEPGFGIRRRSDSDAICSALESSITDAEQQLCPAVAQRSSDVTVEECADTEDLVIGNAEQLIACPGSGSIDPPETRRRCAISLHTRRHTRQPLWVAFVRTLASSVPCCPARAHEWGRVHETVRLRTGLICDSIAREQHHRHRPANLPNSDTDRVLVQRGANVPSEECEDAFHQREETKQLFACPVSVQTVPIKIWNQKGSLNIATFAEHTRTLCTPLDLSCPAGMPCADAVVTLNVRSLAMTSSYGGLKTLPRIRQRGIQSSPCSTQWKHPAGENELKIVMASLDGVGKTTTSTAWCWTQHSSDSHPSHRSQRRECGTQELTVWSIGGQGG